MPSFFFLSIYLSPPFIFSSIFTSHIPSLNLSRLIYYLSLFLSLIIDLFLSFSLFLFISLFYHLFLSSPYIHLSNEAEAETHQLYSFEFFQISLSFSHTITSLSFPHSLYSVLTNISFIPIFSSFRRSRKGLTEIVCLDVDERIQPEICIK